MAKTSDKTTAKSTTKKAVIKQKECFVIMPFGGYFDTYYQKIYIPAIDAAGLNYNRADNLYRSSSIINDIWRYTKQADVILADLTGKNPNVFYELGLAHAITKPAVLVAESMEDVPFDLRSLRVITYDKNIPNWGGKLQNDIKNALVETLDNPEDTIPPTFLKTHKSKPIEVSEQEKELLEIKSDIDALKREVRSNYEKTASINNMSEDELYDTILNYVKRGLSRIEIVKKLNARTSVEMLNVYTIVDKIVG